jgi:hypothetical protein
MKILARNDHKEKWQLVQAAAFKGERSLQELLADEPSLISIDEIREGSGDLLVAVREFPLPIGNIDILGFSAKGDIAIIECKLASNSEIKRQVIGQVFEYGANLWEMDYETLDSAVKLRNGKSLVELIQEEISDSIWDEEAFRNRINNSLENGDFILVIVVDEIKEELTRIIRFINDAGKPAFSFAALEMQRFQHNSTEMLVPHVIGVTRKPHGQGTPKVKWDENKYFNLIKEKFPESLPNIQKLYDWSKLKSRIWWGEGSVIGSFVPVIPYGGKSFQLFAVYTSGDLEILFQYYLSKPPFNAEEKRIELLNKLNQIGGVRISKDKIERRPSIPFETINTPEKMDQFISVFEWVIQEVNKKNI